MSNKWLFNVLSKSSASKIHFLPSFGSNLFNPDRFSISPLGNYNNLSDVASSTYRTAKAMVAGQNHSEISSFYHEAHAFISSGLKEVKTSLSYVDRKLEFTDLPKSVMSQFGFSPLTNEECPILQVPSAKDVDNLAATFVPGGAGTIYAGRVNLNKYEGGKHFYMVAAKCGNVNAIAQASRLPADRVTARLGSMLGMLATWAGCMMAGGADVEPAPGALDQLDKIDKGVPVPKNAVIGKGILTYGADMVQLQNPTSAIAGGTQLHSFLARTLYFHALVGTVLHMQYIAVSGDITWFWVGGGGKGFMSKRINNTVAIQLDIGIWPDMARSIKALYEDPEVVRKFVGATPQTIDKLIPQLIASTTEKKSLFLQLVQFQQVANPVAFGVRLDGFLEHLGNGIKGEN